MSVHPLSFHLKESALFSREKMLFFLRQSLCAACRLFRCLASVASNQPTLATLSAPICIRRRMRRPCRRLCAVLKRPKISSCTLVSCVCACVLLNLSMRPSGACVVDILRLLRSHPSLSGSPLMLHRRGRISPVCAEPCSLSFDLNVFAGPFHPSQSLDWTVVEGRRGRTSGSFQRFTFHADGLPRDLLEQSARHCNQRPRQMFRLFELSY